jgi:hypothetical protein
VTCAHSTSYIGSQAFRESFKKFHSIYLPIIAMALAKRPSRLVGLIQESDADEISSDSLVSFVAESVSAEPNTVPLRRGRGRPPAAKVTKPAQRVASRQDHGSTTNAARRSTRRALDQKSTNDVQKPQRGRKPVEAKQIQGRGRGRPKANSNPATVVSHEGGSTGGDGAETDQLEIQDSQSMMLGEDDVTADVIMDDLEAVSPQKPTLSSPFKRATESTGSDAQLRRRIGDLTRRCEAWEAKYRELREIGIKEAEANFDRLKRQADERTNGMWRDPQSVYGLADGHVLTCCSGQQPHCSTAVGTDSTASSGTGG